MSRPPRLPRWLLARFVPSCDRELFLGDVDDAYALRAARHGPGSARRWYWRQTLASLPTMASHRVSLLADAFSNGSSSRHGDPMWRNFLDDLRYSVRLSKRNPLSAAAVIATMVLGIGAVTALFSVVNGVLLKPLPFAESGQVVQLGMTLRDGRQVSEMAYPDVQDFRRQVGSLAAVSAVSIDGITLTQGDEPQQLLTAAVDSGYGNVFSIRPALGRLFDHDEFRYGAMKVVVLSNSLWQRQFGGDHSILGRTISLGHEPYLVIGVLPPMTYLYPVPKIDLLTPLILAPGTFQANRGALWLRAVARIKSGVPYGQAATEILGVGKNITAEFPDAYGGLQFRVEPLHRAVVGDVQPMLILLSVSVAMVLLIACVNIANLLLGQSHTRAREFAVRAALGGSAGRIRRQLLTESVLWAGLGGVIGTALAPMLTRAFIALYPGDLPRVREVGIDFRVLAVAVASTALAGVLSSVPMARRAVASDLTRDLRSGGRSATSGHRRLGGILVASQVAMSLVLLFAAGLLLRTFHDLTKVDPGFTSRGVMTFGLSTTNVRYPEAADVRRYFDAVDQGLRALPGTVDVATSSEMSFDGNQATDVFVDKLRGDRGRLNPQVRVATVSPTYWSTLGIRILSGRTFAPTDGDSTPHVVVINEALANKYYPGENPIGRILDWNRRDWEIVGVVGSAHMNDLWTPAEPELYTSTTQRVRRGQFILVKSALPSSRILPEIRRIVHAVDPTVAITDVETMDDRIAEALAPQRFRAALVIGLGLIALVLSVVGMYGVVSYAVTRQTREIGIRMALGEEAAHVRRRVVVSALHVVAIGAAAGIAMALIAGRSLQAFLVGVSPHDPALLGATVLLLTAVAAAAAYVPARRASRVDPLAALRSE